MSAIHATHTPDFDTGSYLGQDVSQRRDTPRHLPLDNSLQWGSDPSFCYHGFSCPIGTWTEERLVRNLMRNMATICDSVNVDFNYDNELPNYPDYAKNPDPVQLNGLDTSRHRQYRSETPGSISSASTSGSEKRKSVTPPSSHEHEIHASPPNKKRKCVQKPGQKLCHCRSEKKRREIIAQGYQDISNIVPALGKHNYTRKYVLEEAAKFIISLTEGNELLRRQVDAMNDQGERDMRDLFLENELKL